MAALAGDRMRHPDPPTIPSLQLLSPMLAFFSGDIALAEAAMDSDPGVAGRLGAGGGAGQSAPGSPRTRATSSGMRADIDAAYEDFAQIGDRWGLSSVLSARGTAAGPGRRPAGCHRRLRDGAAAGDRARGDGRRRLQSVAAVGAVPARGRHRPGAARDRAGPRGGSGRTRRRSLIARCSPTGILIAIELQRGNLVARCSAMSAGDAAPAGRAIRPAAAGPRRRGLRLHHRRSSRSATTTLALAMSDLTANYPVALIHRATCR